MEPTTQGQQTPAETANGSTITQPAEGTNHQPNGVEQRINELVGKYKALEDNYSKVSEQNSMLLGTLAELATKSSAPASQTQVQIDPEEAARVRAVLAPELQRLESMNAQLLARLGQQEFQAATTGEDPRVVARAKELEGQWRAARLTGWKPTDAITYARGEVAGADQLAQRQAQASRQQFQSSNPVLQGGNAQPVVAQMDTVPADLGQWSIDKQVAFWEKRSGDRPF